MLPDLRLGPPLLLLLLRPQICGASKLPSVASALQPQPGVEPRLHAAQVDAPLNCGRCMMR